MEASTKYDIRVKFLNTYQMHEEWSYKIDIFEERDENL